MQRCGRHSNSAVYQHVGNRQCHESWSVSIYYKANLQFKTQLSRFAFFGCDETLTKSSLEKEGCSWLPSYLKAETMEESCLLPFSACFLIPPMTTQAEMAPSTESWALPHQSSILKTSPQTWLQAEMVEATPCLKLPLPKWQFVWQPTQQSCLLEPAALWTSITTVMVFLIVLSFPPSLPPTICLSLSPLPLQPPCLQGHHFPSYECLVFSWSFPLSDHHPYHTLEAARVPSSFCENPSWSPGTLHLSTAVPDICIFILSMQLPAVFLIYTKYTEWNRLSKKRKSIAARN